MSGPENTCRYHRLHGYGIPVDPSKEGKFVQLADGSYKPGIFVKDQSVNLDFSKMYLDDAVAFIRDLYVELDKARPGRVSNKHAIDCLNQAVYAADREAVERHGYSGSEDERNVVVPY